MYGLYHKLLLKSEGSVFSKPLLSCYFLMSSYYSLLSNTLGCVNNLIPKEPIYRTCNVGERVPTLTVVREVEDMLKQHGFLNSENSDHTYNSQNQIGSFPFDFSKVKSNEYKFVKGVNNLSDGDTTFITDETNVSDDDISLSDLDEFISLMQSCENAD